MKSKKWVSSLSFPLKRQIFPLSDLLPEKKSSKSELIIPIVISEDLSDRSETRRMELLEGREDTSESRLICGPQMSDIRELIGHSESIDMIHDRRGLQISREGDSFDGHSLLDEGLRLHMSSDLLLTRRSDPMDDSRLGLDRPTESEDGGRFSRGEILLGELCESSDDSITRCLDRLIVSEDSRIDLQSGRWDPTEDESWEGSDTREGDISLSRYEGISEIHHGRVESHPLTLVDGDRPGESEGDLVDAGLHSSFFLYLPAHREGEDFFSWEESDDRIDIFLADDRPDRAIHISRIKVVFHEHDSCSDLQDEGLWSETSFLQGGRQLLGPLSDHLWDKGGILDLIESREIVLIDGDIMSEELGMIRRLDLDSSSEEEIDRGLRDFTWSDLTEDIEEWIIDLSIGSRQSTDSESEWSPSWMLEGKATRSTRRDGRELEKVSDEDDLYPSERSSISSSSLEESGEWVEKISWEHRDLIDDEYLSLSVSLLQVRCRNNRVDHLLIDGLSDPESAPAMDRHPSDMSRSDPRRGSDSDGDPMLVAMSDESIHEKSLPRTRRPCEEDIHTHRQYVECLILCHRGRSMKNSESLCQKNLFLDHVPVSKITAKRFLFLELLVFEESLVLERSLV